MVPLSTTRIGIKRQVMITVDDDTLIRLQQLGNNRSAVVREAVEQMYLRMQEAPSITP
jgi:predicted transcriptional regulator